MFRVTCTYEIGEDWDVKDEALFRAAGRRSASSGASCDSKNPNKKVRDLVWFEKTIEEAQNTRLRLIQVGGCIVTFREV